MGDVKLTGPHRRLLERMARPTGVSHGMLIPQHKALAYRLAKAGLAEQAFDGWHATEAGRRALAAQEKEIGL